MKTFPFLAAVAMLAAAPVVAGPMAPAQYVMTAGAGDLYEIQSSSAVLETTADPRIRDFATMMVSDHTGSTADVKAAAARARVPAMPPKLTPAQAEMIAQLRAEAGPARDATYMAQQKAAQNQALEVQKAYAEGGTAAPLKMAAAKIVPVVRRHIEMLKAM